MFIDVVNSLMTLLKSINGDSTISNLCNVTILSSEMYREIIATNEKNGKVEYPIIVLYDGNIDYDSTRFYNDVLQSDPYTGLNPDGEEVIYRDVHKPLMPYNLSYRVEIICKKRIQLDNILLWVLRNIPDRGVLDVPYKDVNNNDCIYNSILTRGNVIKGDEGTSSTLYRRIFELKLTTLIDGGILSKDILTSTINVTEQET